jgi:hypothetical protein
MLKGALRFMAYLPKDAPKFAYSVAFAQFCSVAFAQFCDDDPRERVIFCEVVCQSANADGEALWLSPL